MMKLRSDSVNSRNAPAIPSEHDPTLGIEPTIRPNQITMPMEGGIEQQHRVHKSKAAAARENELDITCSTMKTGVHPGQMRWRMLVQEMDQNKGARWRYQQAKYGRGKGQG
ncbi:hypothetical protein K7X08_035392 [Anisodus acutangulus]|uniref:Uncharacterized protein n=1 Tax=Anisodus acutangulus TaxID=402998 RepID=A0A9Q1LIZ1_9SOLA|nr:hypothetical protein K7X08_035392 [Anisodus acutangulus]